MTKPRQVTTDPPWAKPVEDWPCHCCTCTHGTVGITDADPRCHVHGHHGQRGCVKHGIDPAVCDCGCKVDNHDVEQARHAEYLARGERFAAQEYFAGVVHIDTEDTPEGLEAVKAAKAKIAAEQAAVQLAALQPAIQAAVDAALAKQASNGE